jgi:hypothetical protein
MMNACYQQPGWEGWQNSMRIAFFGLLLAVLLLLAVGRLPAQTETVISARDLTEAQTRDDQAAGWTVDVNPDTTLEARFTIDNPTPKPGSTLNYELLIVNKGGQAITLPRALNWEEVNNGSQDQRYRKAAITLELRTDKGFTYITPTLNLYSTQEKPGTTLILRPGDSLRLLGTTILPVTAFSPQSAGRAKLIGHLCVRDVSKAFTPSPSGRTGNNNYRQQILWCANAEEKYEVNYEPQQ